MNNNKGNSINAGFAQHLINNNNNDEQFHNSAPNINVGGLNITIEGNSGISSISQYKFFLKLCHYIIFLIIKVKQALKALSMI